MEDRDVFILEEIVDYCDKIAETLVRHGEDFGKFKDDSEYQDVCAFRAMQIGELVNGLSDKFKDLNPEMPWHRIVAFRNIISHDYGKVDFEVMWEAVTEDVPRLREFCARQIG